jgi:hypothetical protein
MLSQVQGMEAHNTHWLMEIAEQYNRETQRKTDTKSLSRCILSGFFKPLHREA